MQMVESGFIFCPVHLTFPVFRVDVASFER